MGLGLYIVSIVDLGIKKSKNKTILLEEIKNYCLSIGDSLFQKLVKWSEEENELCITFHRSEEPVNFSFNDNDELICSAKTSSAGPGYHAFLIDTLENLGEELEINWIWDDDEGDIGDDTNYHSSKNFQLLQVEMMTWLQGFSKILIEKKEESESTNWYLSLPLEFERLAFDESFFALSSMGYWSEDWFEKVVELSVDDLEKEARKYFPWWNKDLDARFWLNSAMVLLWTECPWHFPSTKNEANLYKIIDECLERAYSLDDSLNYPWDEWKQILTYLKDEKKLKILKDITPPDHSKTDIGFRKQTMIRPLIEPWNINLPGYFYNGLEDEGSTVVYWYEDKTIQSSSLSMTPTRNIPPGDHINNWFPMKNEAPNEIEVITLETRELLGKAGIKFVQEEDENYWMLMGVITKKEIKDIISINITTIYFDENDIEWAIKTWKSIN